MKDGAKGIEEQWGSLIGLLGVHLLSVWFQLDVIVMWDAYTKLEPIW